MVGDERLDKGTIWKLTWTMMFVDQPRAKRPVQNQESKGHSQKHQRDEVSSLLHVFGFEHIKDIA